MMLHSLRCVHLVVGIAQDEPTSMQIPRVRLYIDLPEEKTLNNSLNTETSHLGE